MYISQITADRIKELREAKGISAAELNKVCDLSKNTITASANGKNGLSAKILFDVAKFLDCSVDYLLGVTDDPMPTKELSACEEPKTATPTDELFMEVFRHLELADRVAVMQFAFDKMEKST